MRKCWMSRLWTTDGRRNVKIELEFWKQNSQKDYYDEDDDDEESG